MVSPLATGADLIHAEIIRQIEECELVLADMSALNANVFFELGIRTAVDKPVALVKDHLTTYVPFDMSLINHHTYNASLAPWLLKTEIHALRDHLLSSVNGSQGRNTLWKYFGLTAKSKQRTDSLEEDKLDLILRMLERTRPVATVASGAGQGTFEAEEDYSAEALVITAARALARILNAEFVVKEKNLGRVVLDLAGYTLTDEIIQAAHAVARVLAVELTIFGGKIESSADLEAETDNDGEA